MYEQAKELGIPVDVVRSDGKRLIAVMREDIEPDAPERTALALADNRLGELAFWHDDVLEGLYGDLPDGLKEVTGFTDSDFGGKTVEPPPPPAPPADPLTQDGDLYALGAHRVVCGDSRDNSAVSALFNGDMADAVITDPPYGVDYVGKTADALEVENDDAAGLEELLRGALGIAFEKCRPGGAWYIAAPAGPQFYEFATVLRENGVWRQTIVWVKDSMVLGRSDYHYQHEVLFYGWKPGAAHHELPDRKQTTIWNFDRPKASREHPTMKPVALMAHAIKNSTDTGALVYDPFSGSGTTLLACEGAGRRCYGVELSPAYCDVIVQRYCDLKGIESGPVFETKRAE